MTKEEIADYLSNVSAIKETVLDNFDNRNNVSKVLEQDLKKYTELYENIKPYEQTALCKIAEELKHSKISDTYLTKHQEEIKKLTKLWSEIIKPTLTDELISLNSKYSSQFEQWEKELSKLNGLTRIAQLPSQSMAEVLFKQQKELGSLKELSDLSNQHITAGIDALINTPSVLRSTKNKNSVEEERQMSNITITKIQLSNFRFFIDEEDNNTFEPNKKGMLIYGENGSGKSSLFKAFEFLAKTKISEDEFKDNKNIFNLESPTSLNFEFSNDKSLSITDDNLSIDNSDIFITNLSIFKPILNYQELLKISYNENSSINEQKNLYTFFEKILEDYPIAGSTQKLKELSDPDEHYEKFKEIIENDLFDNINHFLEMFKHSFKITKIKLSGVGKTAYLEIDYFDKDITNHKYHLFLNEARLSALGMSVYFAIIKKQFDLLEDNSLKILVLDDLLISLDMNNRLCLIEILQDEFSDYQIFFFTHEKGLFDLFKDKMGSLKHYEIYVKKKDNYEVPFIKQSNSLLEQAIQQMNAQNYGCSANLLRQSTEELLCKFLPNELTVGDRCKVLDLDKLLRQAIKHENSKKESKEIIENLNKLKTFKTVLLNDASHYNDTNIYKVELEEAIVVLETLKENFKIEH